MVCLKNCCGYDEIFDIKCVKKICYGFDNYVEIKIVVKKWCCLLFGIG